MFKLLSENQKKIIWKEYRGRRAIIFLMFLLATGVITALLISPASYFSGFRNESLKSITKNLEDKMLEKEQSTMYKDLRDLNLKIDALKNNSNIPVDKIIDSLLDGMTGDIKVKSFVYSQLPDNVQGIVISGVAKTRDSIVTFEKKVNNTKGVTSADVPISDFVKDSDIPFTMNISGKFQNQ